MSTTPLRLALFALALIIPLRASAADAAPPAPAPGAAVTPFSLPFCVTCGDEIGTGAQDNIVTRTHKGREVKLCKGCVKIFTADPDGYLKQVDKAIKTGKPVRTGH
jgi:hypothetical protein